MTDFFNPRLALGLTNRYPLAYIKSREERRLVKQLESLSKTHYGDSRPVHIWTCSEGLDGNLALADPLAVIRHIRSASDDGLFLLKDMPSLFESNPVLVRALRDLYESLLGTRKYVFLSHPGFLLPEELRGQAWFVDLGMPDAQEIASHLH
ncbi:MAG: hypothetical protein RL333_826, partial [Pseudomonadota bacterium]